MNTLDILLLLLDLIFFSLLLRSIIIVFWSSNMSRVYAFDYSSATPWNLNEYEQLALLHGIKYVALCVSRVDKIH